MKKIFFLFALTNLIRCAGYGQEMFYNIINYTSREIGLDMLVLEIVPDHNGTLWIRDYSNIGTFNGKSFTNLTSQFEKIAGGPQEVYDIYADTNGNMYISSNSGLYLYNDIHGFHPLNLRFNNKKFDKKITALNDLDSLHLIAGTLDGYIYKINKLTGIISLESLIKKNLIIKSVLYAHSMVWVNSASGIYRLDQEKKVIEIKNFELIRQFQIFDDNRHQKIKTLQDGNLIANDNKDHIYIISPTGEILRQINFDIKATDDCVNDWIELDDGKIYFASSAGIFNYELNSNKLSLKSNNYLIKNSLYDKYLCCIAITKNNVILTGSASCISKINFINEQFINYNYHVESKTVLVKEISTLSNQWIIVTESDGILKYNPSTKTIEKLMDLDGLSINNAHYDECNNALYLGTEHKILRVDLDQAMPNKHEYKVEGTVNSISVYLQDLYYISDNNLYHILPHTSVSKKILKDSFIRVIYHDQHGLLYVGGRKLYCIDQGIINELRLPDQDSLNPIVSMTSDDYDNLYFTKGRNLIQYNTLSKKFQSYDQNQGLPNESLSYIVYDGGGNIWLCSRASGLCKFNINSIQSTYYNENDGLVDNTYLFGLSKVKDKIIAAHRWQFFSYYNPKILNKLVNTSKIWFTNIRINNEVKTADILSSRRIQISSSSSLVDLKLEFPNFISEDWYKLQYRLISNKDTLWSDIASDHKIILNQIAPGNYNLEVKATSAIFHDDSVSSNIQVISLSPFYLKWWFFVFCSLCSYALIWAALRYQTNQRKKIENIRATISKDLHDEMGSNLSSIMLTGELALMKNSVDHSKVKEMVDKTSDVMRSMSDIVWSINPGNDSLPNIVHKIQRNCLDILEPMGITITFDIAPEIATVHLDMYKRQALYMIFKESINNCAKYSKATQVHLKISIEKQTAICIFRDDGIGFDMHTIERGNGLNNIIQRAKQINAIAQINTAIGQGTSIMISLKV